MGVYKHSDRDETKYYSTTNVLPPVITATLNSLPSFLESMLRIINKKYLKLNNYGKLRSTTSGKTWGKPKTNRWGKPRFCLIVMGDTQDRHSNDIASNTVSGLRRFRYLGRPVFCFD